MLLSNFLTLAIVTSMFVSRAWPNFPARFLVDLLCAQLPTTCRSASEPANFRPAVMPAAKNRTAKRQVTIESVGCWKACKHRRFRLPSIIGHTWSNTENTFFL